MARVSAHIALVTFFILTALLFGACAGAAAAKLALSNGMQAVAFMVVACGLWPALFWLVGVATCRR